MPKLTHFEKSVYAATMEIPLGETRSYAWIARRIGSSKSSRAVGNALNKNPYAPFVPCHRVISSSGALGGFQGGLRKKRGLLRRERECAKEAQNIITSVKHAQTRPTISRAEIHCHFS